MRQTPAEARGSSRARFPACAAGSAALAGPGAISTTIINAQKDGLVHVAALVVCIAHGVRRALCGCCASRTRSAQDGTTGLNIATRLLGLLLPRSPSRPMARA